LIPINGQPYLAAMSITLQIFSAKTSLNEPPKTVKSWLIDEHPPPEDLPVPSDDRVAVGAAIEHPEV